MADLKSYDHADQVISPDDLKLSEDHGKERLTTQADIAEGRIKEISVNRNRGRGHGGLDEFFEGTEFNPWTLANQVTNRVFSVVEESMGDYNTGLNGSSAATLENNILRYTGTSVLNQIRNIRHGGLHSLQTLETLKGFTVSAMEEANAQQEEMKRRQAEVIENRGWWSRVGHKALTYGTLGAYSLVKTEKRQGWYNALVENSMKRQFKGINRNIEQMEQRVGKQIAPMESRIRRTLVAAHDPEAKATLQAELIEALRQPTRGALSSINLASFGITDNQDKINFLEAAQNLDFVKKDLGVIGTSRAKEQQQAEMLTSARKQQEILKTGAFRFSNIQGKAGFEQLSIEGVEVPEISELVKTLENEIASFTDLEAIYAANIDKADLLTDSAKLILLVDYVSRQSLSVVKTNFQVSTRQSLLAWISDMDTKTGGSVEQFTGDNRTAVETIENLFDDTVAGSLASVAKTRIAALGTLDMTRTQGIFNAQEQAVRNFSDTVLREKQTFENLIKTFDTFPAKDKKDIQDAFTKMESIRSKMVTIIAQWKREKQESSREAALLAVFSLADGRLDTELLKPVPVAPHAAAAHQQTINGLRTDVNQAQNKLQEHRNKYGNLSLADITSLQGEINALGRQHLTFSAEKKPGIGTLDQRIRQNMKAESFKAEIDKKFVEQLEKNDQFDQLKQVSKGTRVRITYKQTSAGSLSFPDQLAGALLLQEFIVVASTDKGVLLEDTVNGRSIAILGSAAKGGSAYKNARVSNTVGSRTIEEPMVSGSWNSAIALNYKIS